MPDNDTGLFRRAGSLIFPASLLMLFASSGIGQVASKTNPDQTVNLNVSQVDKSASSYAISTGAKQILTPSAGVGVRVNRSEIAENGGGSTNSSSGLAASSSDSTDDGTVPSPGYYTTDLSNPKGGPVITDMVGHPIYINTTPATVGNPAKLLRDLGQSDLVHVIDQYVGAQADNRYTVGVGGCYSRRRLPVPLSTTRTFRALFMRRRLISVRSGDHAEYHVFMGPGQDVCFENKTSPVLLLACITTARFRSALTTAQLSFLTSER